MPHVPTPHETNGFLDYSIEAYRLDYYPMCEIHFQNRLCMRYHLDCIQFYPEMTLRLVTLARYLRSHIPPPSWRCSSVDHPVFAVAFLVLVPVVASLAVVVPCHSVLQRPHQLNWLGSHCQRYCWVLAVELWGWSGDSSAVATLWPTVRRRRSARRSDVLHVPPTVDGLCRPLSLTSPNLQSARANCRAPPVQVTGTANWCAGGGDAAAVAAAEKSVSRAIRLGRQTLPTPWRLFMSVAHS